LETLVLLLVDLISTLVEIALKGISVTFWALRSTEVWSWAVCIAIASLPSYAAYQLWAAHPDAAGWFSLAAAAIVAIKLVLFVSLRRRGKTEDTPPT
jgi:hypothetical protein